MYHYPIIIFTGLGPASVPRLLLGDARLDPRRRPAQHLHHLPRLGSSPTHHGAEKCKCEFTYALKKKGMSDC